MVSGVFVSAVILNDSDDSELGAGTYLDGAGSMGYPAYTPQVIAPGDSFYVQGRFGDPSFWVRFGVGFEQMDQMAPGLEYSVAWETPPGAAARDNATWEFDAGQELLPFCCKILRSRCFATRDEWGVMVIEEGAVLSFPTFNNCYRNYFLSWILD